MQPDESSSRTCTAKGKEVLLSGGRSSPRRHGPRRSSAVATTTRSSQSVRLGVSTVGSEVASNGVVLVVLVVSSGVDADLDPGKEPVGDVVAQVQELGEGVVVGVGLDNGPHVLVVGGHVDGVGVIGRRRLDGGAQLLGVEELADVGDGLVPDGDGAVGHDRRVGVGEQVGVRRAAVVVAREDGLEGDDTLVVGQLHTTEVGGVHAVLGVVARDGDSGVNTGRVGVPDVDSDIGNGRAVRDVHVLDLEEQIDAVGPLSLLDVAAEVFANHIVRASGDLRGEDARSVRIEDGLEGREHIIVADASVVVVHRLPLLKGSQVTAVLLGVGLDAAGLAQSLDSVGSPLDVALLDAAGGSRVGTSTEGTGTNFSSQIADFDLPLDVIIAMLLAGVSEDTGSQAEAGGDLGKSDHFDERNLEDLE